MPTEAPPRGSGEREEPGEPKVPWNAEGEEMPYHWPRQGEFVSAHSIGFHAIRGVVVLLFGLMIAAFVYMFSHPLH
jgi:hypothetical protein